MQNPFRMGYETVKALGLTLSGAAPPKIIDTGSTLILASDLEKAEVKELISPDLRRWLDPAK